MKNSALTNRQRRISTLLLVLFLSEIFTPTVSFALTSGPSQPEFSSFEPVATTSMVDQFSGDFTYNIPVVSIPGPDGSGYSLSLSYHSGISPEQEASWVGYGWSLNPGAINRTKVGFADDWDGAEARFYNKVIDNQTVTIGGSVGATLYSSPSPSIGAGLRYNNYRGFGYTADFGLSIASGLVSLGMHIDDGESTYGAEINPMALMSKLYQSAANEADKIADENSIENTAADAYEQQNKQAETKYRNIAKNLRKSSQKAKYGSRISKFSFGSGTYRPLNVPPAQYIGSSQRGQVNFGLDLVPALNGTAEGSVYGSYTKQITQQIRDSKAFGYGYSGTANETGEIGGVMDYYVERPSGYQKFDMVLPTPLSNYDRFQITGEGHSGGFRLLPKHIGVFHPQGSHSNDAFFAFGADSEAGTGSSLGYTGSLGYHTLDVMRGDVSFGAQYSSLDDEEDRPFRMKFMNDKGGNVKYSGSLNNQFLTWHQNLLGGFTGVDFAFESVQYELDDDEGNRSSASINFNLNKDMTKSSSSNEPSMKAYTKSMEINENYVNRQGAVANQIGEISSVNENGMRFTYGLPVYTRKEQNMQFSIPENALFDNKGRVYNYDICSGQNFNSDLKTIVGHEIDEAYAATYLLTEMTSPNYIDRKMDGPTPDDWGGYTVFSYDKVYGDGDLDGDGIDDDEWYDWRMPYTGLNFNRNTKTDPRDDLGSYIAGQKEIYYLDRISTKTHRAEFITSPREDGLSADDRCTAATDLDAQGTSQLKKLDRIDLYRSFEDGSEKLLQSTFFEYEDPGSPGELSKNLPNALNGSGKLTLKKVWTEYNGIVKENISPYEFHYEYPANAQTLYQDVKQEYGALAYNAFTGDQNPDYDLLATDPWGNYRPNGTERREKEEFWIDQSLVPNVDFDPAAWHLKKIVLPSGGEIHVQYEQDEYAFVQDHPAHSMVRLHSHNLTSAYFDLEDFGFQPGSAKHVEALERVKIIMDQYYIQGKRKMFFRYLFKLQGGGLPALTDCMSEYIEGYVNVSEISIVGDQIKVDYANEIPYSLCQDYYRTQCRGNITSGSDCGVNPVMDDNEVADALTVIYKVSNMFANLINPDNSCVQMSPEHSFLRVPLPTAKKGGGVRVKRLLMYDGGFNMNMKSLYGTEYFYSTVDDDLVTEISSGVATNEPMIQRLENPLINLMERFSDGTEWKQRLIAGKDRKQVEGPLGETLLPSPTVGYSKITAASIHSGKSHPGFTVSEFHTNKEYPLLVENAENNFPINGRKTSPTIIPGTYTEVVPRLRQYFEFNLNSMHGMPKSTKQYSDHISKYLSHDLKAHASEEYEYYPMDAEVPVLDAAFGDIGLMNLGIEMDIAVESKKILDFNLTVMAEGETGVESGPPVTYPWISGFGWSTQNINNLHTFVTSKVIRYPAIVKSKTVFQEGLWSKQENLAFDRNTGNPIITKTYDEYHPQFAEESDEQLLILSGLEQDGFYTNYAIPASWNYNGMGQKSWSEGKLIEGTAPGGNIEIEFTANNEITFSAGSGPNAGSALCDALNSFTSGDLIELVISGSTKGNYFHVDELQGTVLSLLKTSFSDYDAAANQLVDINILRSGRTNQLNAMSGSVLTYGGANSIDQIIQNGPPMVDPNSALFGYKEDFANLLNSVNSNTGPGSLMSSQIQAISPELQFAIDGICQPLPNDLMLILEGGKLDVYDAISMTVTSTADNMPCEQVSHHCSSYLNNMAESLWTASVNVYASDLRPSACQYTTYTNEGIGHVYNNYSTDQGELEPLFDEYLLRPVNPQLSGPILNARVEPVYLNESAMVDNGTWTENKSFAMRLDRGQMQGGDSEDVFVFCTLTCSDQSPTGLDIIYGTIATDDPSLITQNELTYQDIIASNLPTVKRKVFLGIESEFPGTFIPEDPQWGGTIANCVDLVFYSDDGTPDLVVDIPIATKVSAPAVFGSPTNLLCSVDLLDDGSGEFFVDSQGQLKYHPYGSDCAEIDVPCLSLCGEENYSSKGLRDVVSCGFSTYSDEWDYSFIPHFESSKEPNSNAFENAERGRWRMQSTYYYRDDYGRLSAHVDADPNGERKSYNSGVFDFNLFNWNSPPANDTHWKKTTTISKYSPQGHALEEENIIGVKSVAKYGYNDALPYLIASNSDYSSSKFLSFENTYDIGGVQHLEDGVVLPSISEGYLTTDKSHTGETSFELSSAISTIELMKIEEGSDILNQGARIMFWMSSDIVRQETVEQSLHVDISSAASTAELSVELKSRSGIWALYEAKIGETHPLLEQDAIISLRYEKQNNVERAFVDDIRIQPTQAEMVTYVYDTGDFKLIATIDDQHFATIYQYNNEGQLIRKLVETERGIKTIQETQYNSVAGYPRL